MGSAVPGGMVLGMSKLEEESPESIPPLSLFWFLVQVPVLTSCLGLPVMDCNFKPSKPFLLQVAFGHSLYQQQRNNLGGVLTLTI